MVTVNLFSKGHAAWLLAAALTALLLSSPARAYEDSVEMPAPPPALASPPPAEPSFSQAFSSRLLSLGRSAERTHDLLQASILEQAIKFDDFFGTVNSKKEQRTAYLLRWRNSFRVEEGRIKLGSTLRADVQLSRIDEKLRLSFSGESEGDPSLPRLPEDPGAPGLDRTFQNARIVNTELRYQFVRSMATTFFVGTGVDLTFPLQLFVRSRYEHRFKLTDRVQLRVAETVFDMSHDGLGETTEVSLDRSINPKTLLRLSNSGTLSEQIGAMEWGSELSLLRTLTPKSAVTLTAGVYGKTGEADIINNYRLFVRYRRNFLRSWLFYEVEPEVFWPRQDDGSFPTTYAITFRLEVVFEGKEKGRMAPETPLPREPAAPSAAPPAAPPAAPHEQLPAEPVRQDLPR